MSLSNLPVELQVCIVKRCVQPGALRQTSLQMSTLVTEHITVLSVMHPDVHPTSHQLNTLLRQMPRLEELYIDKVNADLKGIVACPCLQELHISRALDFDLNISPLQACPGLQVLSIDNCEWLDLATMSACPNLTSLRYHNDDELDDLSMLTSCTSLTSLDILYCPCLTDIRCLSTFMSLRTLSLPGCYIFDVSSLSGCVALESINLSEGQFENIIALSSCLLLTHLNLCDCADLLDITPLAACQALQRLCLANCCGLEDIATLQVNTCLTVLDIRGCEEEVTTFAPTLRGQLPDVVIVTEGVLEFEM